MGSFYGEIYYREEKHTLKSWEISVWRLATVTLSVCAAWWAPACHVIKDCFVWFTLYFLPQGWYSIQGTRWMLCSEWAAIQYSYPPHTMCHPVPCLHPYPVLNKELLNSPCSSTDHCRDWMLHKCQCMALLWNEVVPSSFCGCWRGKCHQSLKLKLSKGTTDFISALSLH